MPSAQHRKTEQLADRIRSWRESPVQFVCEMWPQVGIEPFQVETLEELVKSGRISIRSGHGVGKTTLLAWITLWHMTCFFPQKTPCTAPSAPQLEDVLWPEIGKWWGKMPEAWKSWYDFKNERLEFKPAPKESFAVARTARKEKPEALQGFHEDNLLFIIDEASGVEDIIFEVAQGALSTPGAKVVMTSNPTRTSGYFHDSHHGMRHRWKCIHVPCEKSSRVSQDYIDDMREKYGADSNVYRVRVDGDFPRSEDDVVIPLDLCESAKVRNVQPSTTRFVWGVDVARFGDDRSALAKRNSNIQVEPTKSWRNKDTMQLSGIIFNEWKDTPQASRPESIMVDVIGIGAGVVDRLKELGLPAYGVNVAESPAVKDRYMRLRDELWFECRDWLDSLDCKLADDDELIAELTVPKYSITSSGKLQVESKDDMKKRGVVSPDKGDAWNLTFAMKDGGGYMRPPKRRLKRA